MLKEASNIFFPQFVLRKTSRILHETIDNWCNSNNIEAPLIEAADNLAVELEVS